MGRLTDNILTILGIKPSDRISPTESSQNTQAKDSSKPHTTMTDIVTLKDLPMSGVDDEISDCLSCKVIGTATLTITAAAVGYYTHKNANRFTGYKRVAVYGQGISLCTLFLLLAACRALNSGPFDHTKLEEPFKDRIVSDAQRLSSLVGYEGRTERTK